MVKMFSTEIHKQRFFRLEKTSMRGNEKKRGKQNPREWKNSERETYPDFQVVWLCVCVLERERERGREKEGARYSKRCGLEKGLGQKIGQSEMFGLGQQQLCHLFVCLRENKWNGSVYGCLRYFCILFILLKLKNYYWNKNINYLNN